MTESDRLAAIDACFDRHGAHLEAVIDRATRRYLRTLVIVQGGLTLLILTLVALVLRYG